MPTFTEAEKTDVRRYMGYPAHGDGNDAFQSWRFFQAYGLLEFRLNHLSVAEEAVVRGHLTRLTALEADLFKVRDNLDTKAAAIWTRNPLEQQDRESVYQAERRRLCDFLGVPAGPNIGGRQMSAALMV